MLYFILLRTFFLNELGGLRVCTLLGANRPGPNFCLGCKFLRSVFILQQIKFYHYNYTLTYNFRSAGHGLQNSPPVASFGCSRFGQGRGDCGLPFVSHFRRNVSRRPDFHVGPLPRPQHLLAGPDFVYSPGRGVCLLQYSRRDMEDAPIPHSSRQHPLGWNSSIGL